MDMIERDDKLFPPDQFDEHNEPLDTRETTSWTQTIEEVCFFFLFLFFSLLLLSFFSFSSLLFIIFLSIV